MYRGSERYFLSFFRCRRVLRRNDSGSAKFNQLTNVQISHTVHNKPRKMVSNLWINRYYCFVFRTDSRILVHSPALGRPARALRASRTHTRRSRLTSQLAERGVQLEHSSICNCGLSRATPPSTRFASDPMLCAFFLSLAFSPAALFLLS